MKKLIKTLAIATILIGTGATATAQTHAVSARASVQQTYSVSTFWGWWFSWTRPSVVNPGI